MLTTVNVTMNSPALAACVQSAIKTKVLPKVTKEGQSVNSVTVSNKKPPFGGSVLTGEVEDNILKVRKSIYVVSVTKSNKLVKPFPHIAFSPLTFDRVWLTSEEKQPNRKIYHIPSRLMGSPESSQANLDKQVMRALGDLTGRQELKGFCNNGMCGSGNRFKGNWYGVSPTIFMLTMENI